MGGVPVEEMATKRKQLKNLKLTGNTKLNPFVALNSLDNEVLIQTARELDIKLSNDDKDSNNVITAIKTE
jgi:hypothetical protein